MTDRQQIPHPHGPITIYGSETGYVVVDHIWGPYMPQDRKTSRRVCVLPRCDAVDRLDVSKS